MPGTGAGVVRVSVVVPAYNSAAYLERALASVAAQSLRDFEVSLVDDGSSDGTADLAERCLARLGLPGRVLRQPNRKIAAARNAGARAARGEFLAFLDSDDAWLPAKLETVLRAFSARPDLDVVCHAERVLEPGRAPRVQGYGPARRDMYLSQLWGGCALSTSATTVRRAKFEAAGGFREDPRFDTVEDYDLWMRLGRLGGRFLFLGEVLGEYRVEGHNSSRRIAYHHDNHEHLLRDHFLSLYGGAPGPAARWRMRRRLSAVYRSALGQLLRYRESPDLQRAYLRRMLRTFPLDPKNLARAAQWALAKC